MPASVMSHSHRPTTKSSHKPFKSKHATKSSLRNAAKGLPHPRMPSKLGPLY